jgi:hypothetical protein
MLRILAALSAWVLLGTGSARPADAAPVVKLGGHVEEADGSVRVRGIVEIAEGHHINAHVPDEVFLIPTVLSLEADGVTFHEATYPEPEAQTFPFSPDKPMLVYGGVPTIIFYDSAGQEVHRVAGFVDADEFRRLMLEAEGNRCDTELC